MKKIYTAVMNRLRTEVPALSWIELNTGQLKSIEKGEILPVTYPCALVGISVTECTDITEKIQQCRAIIRVSLAFDPFVVGETSPDAINADPGNALAPYDVIADVYKALQGFESGNFNALSRIAQGEEINEALFVYNIDFNCEFEDITADWE